MNEVLRLEAKYLRGDSLSPEELKIAQEGLDAELPQERLIACEALLRSNVAENHVILSATRTLEAMCQDAISSNSALDARLVSSLFVIPTNVVLRSELLRKLVYRAATEPSKACRTNAQLALRQLA